MMNISKERATLIAAVIAALASITAAFLSVNNNIAVAKFQAEEATRRAANAALDQSIRERHSFRRSQLDRLTSYALDAAVELQTQVDVSSQVAWLAETTEAEVAERAFRSIGQVRYALTNLLAMAVIEEDQLEAAHKLLSSITLDWQEFSSTRFAYREAIRSGEIERSGHAKTEYAKEIETRYIQETKDMRDLLEKLRRVLSNVQSTIAGIPTDSSTTIE